MSEPTPVLIPLLNPNEPEAVLVAIHVQTGQKVERGAVLCTLETTKSAADLEAAGEGYVIGLLLERGQTVRAGDILCYLAESPDAAPPAAPAPIEPAKQELPPGLRITQPALALARQNGLELRLLPLETLVTEALVRQMLSAQSTEHGERRLDLSLPQAGFDPTAILVYGGGGHGKSVIDLLRALGSYRVVGVIDDSLSVGARVLGLPVLGRGEQLADWYQKGVRLAVNAVGGIGNLNIRLRVFHSLAEAGFACPAIVHPSAVIEPSAELAAGVQVFPHAYVGSESHIGYGAIINAGAIVSHECRLAEYANLSPGAILAGQVIVGAGALVGMGATVNLRVKIGRAARIGNSAVVKSDVPENGLVRAGGIWPE